jgi:hypothetical protein
MRVMSIRSRLPSEWRAVIPNNPHPSTASSMRRTPGLLPNATIVVDHFYAEVPIMAMWCGLLLVTVVTMPVRSA